MAPARAGWLPKGVPVGPVSDTLPAVTDPTPPKPTLPPTEAHPEGATLEGNGSDADVQRTTEHTFGSTSDHLYIVREKNALLELTEALNKATWT